jgi:UDP-2,4-diacetamido-2,4,6-trideoxy-beta-L-altropyranose hydrolase
MDIGTGHVMRCLGLAQALQDLSALPSFSMAQTTVAIEQRLRQEQMNIFRIKPDAPGTLTDAEMTGSLAQRIEANWVVLDGYCFNGEYQEQIRNVGLKSLVIDDNGSLGSYPADVVLDQSPCANEALYSNRGASTKLLLGSGYLLLRREFAKWSRWRRGIPRLGRKLLVSIGGTDPWNLTSKLAFDLAALRIDDLELSIIMSGSNPHLASLQETVRSSRAKLCIRRDVYDMPELLAWADLGMLGAGVTALESCALSLPSVLFPLTDNQIPVATCLRNLGAAWTLKPQYTPSELLDTLQQLLSSQELREQLSRTGRGLVNTLGAERVAKTMLSS